MKRRPQRGSPDAAAQSSPAQGGEPEWDHALTTPQSNAAAVAMVAEAEVEEEDARWMLDVGEALGTVGHHEPGHETPEAESAVDTPTPVTRPDGVMGGVFDDHRRHVPKLRATLSRTQEAELAVFRTTWKAERARYEAVAAKTDVPAVLIAAIHYRESSMDFGTYLHQGDPLGKPAVNHPANIPVFHEWEEAAIHALNMKRGVADGLSLDADTTDRATLGTYAEAYNGLGYHYKGLESPYVYAGSDRYTGGRYVSDGKFDPTSFDRRLGVLTILDQVEGPAPAQAPVIERDPWSDVVAGDTVLDRGDRGEAVTALQERLIELGYDTQAVGNFGPKTEAAVKAFQTDHDIEPDGRVGYQTAAAIETATGPSAAREAQEAAWDEVVAGTLTLERGSEGPAVEALQERLRAHGYGVALDAEYGPATRAAVYDLQKSLGLPVDGGVGAETARALDEAVGR